MEGAELSPVDIDPDFEPQARPRSCTWPLPRPELSVVTPAGTPTAEEGRTEAPPLPNEGPGATPRKGGSRRNAWGNQSYAELISQAIESSPEKRLTLAQIYDWMVRSIPYFKDKGDSNSSAGWKSSPEKRLTLVRIYDWMERSIPYFSDKRDSNSSTGWKSSPEKRLTLAQIYDWMVRIIPYFNTRATPTAPPAGRAPPEKRLTLAQIYDWMVRSNPYFKDKSDSNSSAGWKSSPEKRLTLAQIYDWMVRSIPYFKDKGESNTPAGLKNSIRHNLSLHSKFIKVHNEATGKSSWWMLNPEGGKSGKAPRRRAASMDNSSKLAKARSNKVSKKKAQGPGEPPAGSPGSQSSKWPGSPSQSTDDPEVWTSFRSRTGSNASNLSLRLSPILTEQDDAADDDLHSSLSFSDSVPPTVSEELELIDGLTMLSPGAPLPAPQSMIQTPPGFSMRPAQSLPFGNSLFSPISPVSSHFPRAQTLEALLTSDSPPPSNVLMSQVDPVLAQSGGQNLLLLGGQNKIRSSEHPSVPPTPPNSLPLLGLPPLLSMPLPRPHSFPTVSERLPTDLDIDMFLENLECDVDYIINNDLMDEGGLDFNFEPLHPGNTPSNNHSWLPS